jgi:hypothetical protein
MLEEVNALVAASGLGGLVAGYLVGRYLGNNSIPASQNDFTRKQMKNWNINDDWYNILSTKKKDDFVAKELDKLNQHIKKNKQTRENLNKEQDRMLERMREVRKDVAQAEGRFEVGTILTRMGHISAEASDIRHNYDNVSNALVNFRKSKHFLECVKSGWSYSMIVKEMNKDFVVEAIENNDSLAIEMLNAELNSLGTNAKIDEIKQAIGAN